MVSHRLIRSLIAGLPHGVGLICVPKVPAPMDLPTTEANIASMVDLAQANGIHVVIGSVLPAKDFGWHPGHRSRTQERLAQQMA